MAANIKSLIEKTQILSNLYKNQKYRAVRELFADEARFVSLPEFQDFQKFLQNSDLDFGLQKFENTQLNKIKYGQVLESPQQHFSIGIFIVPKGMVMPLHDHPGMYVFQKNLFGIAKKTTICLDKTQNISKQFTIPLSLQTDNKCNDCNINIGETNSEKDTVSVITPLKNNIHGYVALSNFAFLDVLVPHYDFTSRHCNFYNILKEDQEKNLCNVEIVKMDPNYSTERIELQNLP